MIGARLSELVEAADPAALLRAVDDLVETRSWDDMISLAEACEDAVERGKQLWSIAQHIDYRLALEAPGDYAAAVLQPGVARFALGPLTEVCASTHSWQELSPHIDEPRSAAYVAQERVLRGEVLEGQENAHPEILELPLRLLSFEPTYALARYSSSYVEVAEPWGPPSGGSEGDGSAGPPVKDDELADALLDLVRPWTSESNGSAEVAVVEGNSAGAVRALAGSTARNVPLQTDEGIQRVAWAAASGGAHGRRRGAAYGRFAAWYLATLALGLEWPVDPSELALALPDLSWHLWDEGKPEQGWVLRVVLEHRVDGWAAALDARDEAEDEVATMAPSAPR
ncbi:hypothetical protein BH18ACT16_BH18ACT16_10570 [soil metagenome]